MNNTINILYTCDNDYLELTAVSIASVIYHNQESHINFYIATENDDNNKYKQLVSFYKNNKKIRIIYIDCQKYDNLLEEKKLDKWGSKSFYVYWKMFAYNDLNIDSIWYLDSDVICINKIDNPRIKKEKAMGAVLDSAHKCFNKIAKINEEYYFFNTGALYVDVQRWKKYNCEKRIIDYIQNIKHLPLMCDQDILAVSLQDRIDVLNPKYCYFAGYDYYGIKNSFEMYSLYEKKFYSELEIENSKNKVVFYHCLGGVFGRPWEKDNFSPIKDKYAFYTSLSAWPDFIIPRKKSLLFTIEHKLEKLPKKIYNPVHNFATKIYVLMMAKKANRF